MLRRGPATTAHDLRAKCNIFLREDSHILRARVVDGFLGLDIHARNAGVGLGPHRKVRDGVRVLLSECPKKNFPVFLDDGLHIFKRGAAICADNVRAHPGIFLHYVLRLYTHH